MRAMPDHFARITTQAVPSLARRASAVGSIVLISALGACSGTGGGSESKATGATQRPIVTQTAVESAGPANSGGMLAFFDDLESRPLAAQDDAIHATLLLGTGSSAPTYPQRVAMARELGYVSKTFDRPAHEAITMGEVSQLIVSVLERKRPNDADAALSKLAKRNVIPGSALSYQGLTGAQLVSILGAAQDACVAEGVRRVPAPAVQAIPEPAPVGVASTSVPSSTLGPTAGSANSASSNTPTSSSPIASTASTPSTPTAPTTVEPVALSTNIVSLENAAKNPNARPASDVVVDDGRSKVGRPEALPNLPLGQPSPAIDVTDSNLKPAVIKPDGKVTKPMPPSAPAAAPVAKVEPAKPEAPKPETPKPEAPKAAEPAATEPKKQAKGNENAKPAAANPWVAGAPLKKTASAEEKTTP